jgi:hypothetical protein
VYTNSKISSRSRTPRGWRIWRETPVRSPRSS